MTLKRINPINLLVIFLLLISLSTNILGNKNESQNDGDGRKFEAFFSGNTIIKFSHKKNDKANILSDELFDDNDNIDFGRRDFLNEWVTYFSGGKMLYNREIAEFISEIVTAALVETRIELQNCDVLKNLFEKNIQEHKTKMDIIFDKSYPYCGGTLGNSIFIDSAMMATLIQGIVRDINAGRAVDLDPHSFDCDGDDFVNIIGHETIHAATNSLMAGHADECVVHCLTKKCVDPQHKIKGHEVIMHGKNVMGFGARRILQKSILIAKVPIGIKRKQHEYTKGRIE